MRKEKRNILKDEKFVFNPCFRSKCACCKSKRIDIIKLLNKELAKEIEAQKDMFSYSGDKFEVVEFFHIENNILSLEIRKRNLADGKMYLLKQEVDLHKIRRIVKNINIIFETELNVITTYTNESGEKIKYEDNLFFLQLSYQKNNEYLADKIVKVFFKVGYNIEKGIWAD